MKKVYFSLIIAAILWTIMFLPCTAAKINFWAMMSCSAIVLVSFVTLFRKNWWGKIDFKIQDLFWGMLIASSLWCIFYIGNAISEQLFNFTTSQVESIYSMKEGESPLILTLLMLVLIGPAEEIFWRGYVQQSMGERWGKNRGYIIATLLYTLVHLSSCNFMLIMAALTAGSAWGLLYRLFPKRFSAIIISHAIWDAVVFIWLPIG